MIFCDLLSKHASASAGKHPHAMVQIRAPAENAEVWLSGAEGLIAHRPYVLPDKYVVQCTDAGLGVETPKGILFVKLLEAEHVPKMDVLSKSDPYVKCVS